MRHQVSGYKLGRTKSARIGLRRNLIKQFFTHERIRTTRAKAAAVRGEAERLITIARNSADKDEAAKVHARRLVASRLGGNEAIKRLFDEIAPRFANKPGGYTRVVKLGPRMGDSAEMVILELVEE
ncbi:MAG: 50S ribosomal protein L17 [Anaerolineaceae bacterium]|jgi:large subunit ribosomal protein L17|nr:50S ribosomal protein L17 [Anaerolineae bacterium]MBL1172604.1 50S ribosomal protein L17 [Chloroflexota bacterium]MBV6466507.1 50S ribosomal protein L17 [Anaerolineales bacterium]MDL1926377.1 50S ribosomal protein L17 [Anaerolineae bacterium AMX1]OQY86437.1 MAG: 50S ribosomal protein L17 [Anaerolineae bacterium UTCFX3]GER81017.1 50S ribosomal protein L17 [Candidatus Denitrolinea symbiosum]GJQ38122.1 MAG: 50S ribosomal protein L17 [Anaerolineaceae bacterium]